MTISDYCASVGSLVSLEHLEGVLLTLRSVQKLLEEWMASTGTSFAISGACWRSVDLSLEIISLDVCQLFEEEQLCSDIQRSILQCFFWYSGGDFVCVCLAFGVDSVSFSKYCDLNVPSLPYFAATVFRSSASAVSPATVSFMSREKDHAYGSPNQQGDTEASLQQATSHPRAVHDDRRAEGLVVPLAFL
jgi:hypothetical protein